MISLIIHGGAWDIPEDRIEAHRAGCSKSLQLGWEMLQSGATAVDVVERVVCFLEDDGAFDAGSGSHLNADGEIELDASIMNGKTLRCGAVAAVHRVKNPISLARKVMDESEHILLVSTGAEQFAFDNGMQLHDPNTFASSRERTAWQASQHQQHYTTKDAFRKTKAAGDTVGAVAMDGNGDICVGTSTGGTFRKHPGRVGDSPLIGCGSYAENAVGGVSTTGWGEAMIKVVMAKTVIDIMEMNGGNPQAAAEKGIDIVKRKADGYGGVIVLNHQGKIGIAYNTPRMARAYMTPEMSEPFVAA
ncbi:MAG TPA: isoaspartyl peptidase/L-asparaginase family protein [Bacteroidota bacterium]|jgi:beta-aspartyl-peptidase (threonine type)|nr:isoaspartyl peptidase/L-asparaginase family protein [Bacteroidota bacterium]